MMKHKLITVLILMSSSMLFAQGQIELKNSAEFSTYIEPNTKDTLPTIEFKITVFNHSSQNIPDLGATNRSKYLNFYINDKQNNPLSLYNGVELAHSKKVIQPGDSAEYVVSWILTADSGIERFGDPFTVHWEYKGQMSQKIQVQLKRRTISLIEE